MSRASWGVRVLLIALVAVVLPTGAVTALAQESPRTLDDLFDVFEVGDVPADFVVVVDVSGSMSDRNNPPYPDVLVAYDALVEAIPAGDHLSVVLFSASPELAFNDALDGSNRDAARSILPDVATGQNTDIGAATDSALTRLERADSSTVQTLIFLTDGDHQPAEGTAYPDVSGGAWADLAARAVDVEARHDIQVLGVGLAGGGSTDIGLLRNVFSNPEIVDLPADQLTEFFQEAVRRSRLARLRTLVDSELGNGVRIQSNSSGELSTGVEVPVTLVSDFERLPITVTVDGVTATDRAGTSVPVRLQSDRTITIPPGTSAEVMVLVEPEIVTPRFSLDTIERRDFSIQLTATYQVQPAGLIEAITSVPTTGEVTGIHRLDASRTYGWTIRRIVLTALAVLAALLVASWVYGRFFALPRLSGFLVLKDDRDRDNQKVIVLKGKTMKVDVRQVPRAGMAELKLYTKRGKPRQVFASVERSPFAEIHKGREKPITSTVQLKTLGTYKLGAGELQFLRRAPRKKT